MTTLVPIYIPITGILTATFFFLAATNGIKRFVNNGAIQWLASQHKIFGALAALTAIVHMTLAVSGGYLRLTGTAAMLGVLVTAFLGGGFFQKGSRWLYIGHRIAGPATAVLIIIHIIFNISY